MTLWDKGDDLDREVSAFTVGDDPVLDRELLPYDCRASVVHVRVLERAGVLASDEAAALCAALEELEAEAERGELTIRPEDEDGHTTIERRLTERLGDTGKKVHTARSRNDQVAVALRLYMKDGLDAVERAVERLAADLETRIGADGAIPMPGYTHLRRAMPSSIGMWLGAFAAALRDDTRLLAATRETLDQNPLGSGAGYGIPVFELDRAWAARSLGFARVQENPLYVQNSRGKFEASALAALVPIMADLHKLACDMILFGTDEFGFVRLPVALCTGSSIMPQKQNPDVLEIVRAAYHEVVAAESLIRGQAAGLGSGYHRDFQRTKRPLIEGFRVTRASLGVMRQVVVGVEIDAAACKRAMTPEIFATEKAYERVRSGTPFRDAYRQVADELRRNR